MLLMVCELLSTLSLQNAPLLLKFVQLLISLLVLSCDLSPLKLRRLQLLDQAVDLLLGGLVLVE